MAVLLSLAFLYKLLHKAPLMRIHILGICGTFMGSLAVLAKALGHEVSGSDANVYPPMSTQLEELGIALMEGYKPEHLNPAPDLVIVGNAMSRGNPAVEYVLNEGLPYTSGPQWLSEHVLQGRWVLAAAGTHGKTTTSSMLAWILEYAGMAPGYLIGGVPKNFSVSARLGDTPFFVIEADEYDSAFFDKRSKFVHYQPRTVILNNLEFDHADIFPDLAAIQRQFHHLVRTIPSNGLIIRPADDENLAEVIEQGCWTPEQLVSINQQAEWQAQLVADDGSCFNVLHDGVAAGEVSWSLTGNHNVSNGMAALVAARHVGVTASVACEALSVFEGVKRRMELIGDINGVKIYDDFAHHPTAIETTLQGLRKQIGTDQRILAVIEPRSNTMRLGEHKDKLADVCVDATIVYWYQPAGMDWDLASVVRESPVPASVFQNIETLVAQLVADSQPGDHIVIMSNGGFGGIHQKLVQAIG